MDKQNENAGGEEQERIVIRDKRRVNDESGAPRTPSADPAAAATTDAPAADANQAEQSADVPSDEQLVEIDRLTKELAERTNDLQRVNAEYANYRKRSDRERAEIVPLAQAALLTQLLPVLDDIDRADEHGDLTGGFKNVADGLRKVLTDAGLEEFAAEGDQFDPQIHQAVAQQPSPDVESEQIASVMRKGYRVGDRVVREAMVAVKVPAS